MELDGMPSNASFDAWVDSRADRFRVQCMLKSIYWKRRANYQERIFKGISSTKGQEFKMFKFGRCSRFTALIFIWAQTCSFYHNIDSRNSRHIILAEHSWCTNILSHHPRVKQLSFHSIHERNKHPTYSSIHEWNKHPKGACSGTSAPVTHTIVLDTVLIKTALAHRLYSFGKGSQVRFMLAGSGPSLRKVSERKGRVQSVASEQSVTAMPC